MRETLETLLKRLSNSKALRWLTNPAWERGWDEGTTAGYIIAERLVRVEATNAERRRVRQILNRERARLLDLEEVEWKGYSKELLDEVETIITLVGGED
jgi:hypothetical protein